MNYASGDGINMGLQVLELLAVLAAVIAMAYYATRFIGRRVIALRQGRNVQIVEVVVLGPNRSLCLVKVANRALLLGVTDKQISCLLRLSCSDLQLEGREAAPSFDVVNFLGRLKALVERSKGGSNSGE